MTSQPPSGSQAPLGNPSPRSSASRAAPCTAYADLLVDLSDGELPDELREKVAAHVDRCDACRADLARLDASLARLTGGRGSRRAADVLLRSGSAEASPSRPFDPRIAAALAISLVCLLAVTFAVWNANRKAAPTPQAASPHIAGGPRRPPPHRPARTTGPPANLARPHAAGRLVRRAAGGQPAAARSAQGGEHRRNLNGETL